MSSRRIALVLIVTACALCPAPSATAQPAAKPAPPRTADGKPDLEGFWDFRTLTPLERSANAGDKAFLTEEEARALQSRANLEPEPEPEPRTLNRTRTRTENGEPRSVNGAIRDHLEVSAQNCPSRFAATCRR